jgi:hypothetical protein
MKTAVLTVGQIAEQLEQPPARVAYVISQQRLKPVARVGIIRLFAEEQVQMIRQELARHRRRPLPPVRSGPDAG